MATSRQKSTRGSGVRASLKKNPRLRLEILASVSFLLREFGVETDERTLAKLTLATVDEKGVYDFRKIPRLKLELLASISCLFREFGVEIEDQTLAKLTLSTTDEVGT